MTLTNLQHVDLSGVNLQQDAFAAIIDLPNLQRLILKDAKVDLTPLGSLQQSQFYSLRFFDLSNSTVDWNLVRLLAELRPDVRFRLSPVTAPADLLVQLQNSNQLDIKEDGWGWEVTESSAQHTQFEPPTLDLSVIRGERDSALP
jgi:hypothetical protein